MNGTTVRQHRKALGLTQPQLADMLGLGAQHISDVERGAKSKTLNATARRLLRAYLDGYRPADWPT